MNLRYLLAMIISAGLFALSMPGFELSWLAFIALAPWGVITLTVPKRKWLFDGVFYTCFIFFTSYWLGYVSWVGEAAILFIEVVILFLLGWLFRRLYRKMPATFALPLAWCAVEFLRTRYPYGGLPFGILGYSQYKNLLFIQSADLLSITLISFFVAMVNGALIDLFMHQKEIRVLAAKQQKVLAAVVLILLGGNLLYGVFAKNSYLNSGNSQGPRIVVVQGNIPSHSKGDSLTPFKVVEKYTRLTQLALKEGKPDLLIWAESSFLWPIGDDKPGAVYFLAGSSDYTSADGAHAETGLRTVLSDKLNLKGQTAFLGNFLYFSEEGKDWFSRNSAILYSKNGERLDKYFKIHLAPGGEYVPDLGPITWLTEQLSGLEGFRGKTGTMKPGEEVKVFTLPVAGTEFRFGVSICYDNVFSDVYREATRRGAGFHVVLSNEGWYEDSNASEQFVAASVFRAIETRRSMVRATNSGISCSIDPSGKVENEVEAGGVKKQIEGYFKAQPVISNLSTVYVNIGDWFWWGIWAVVGIFALLPLKKSETISSNPTKS